MRDGFLRALHTGAGPGVVSTIIRCMRWLSWINMVVMHTSPHHHHHHNHHNHHRRSHFGSRVKRALCLRHLFCAFMLAAARAANETGAARRRQRRLRQWLRHERLSVAMTLAENNNHTAPRRQTKARAGGEARVVLHGHVPEAPLPQGRVLRHVVGHLPVLALGVPVPQMVDQLPDVVQFLAAQLLVVPEPVIEVPKILPHDIPPRRWCRDTQLVEQLVEVPTIRSFSSLFQRTVEQHVDIPVPGDGGGSSSGLQGFSSGQRSTASPSRKRISERIVEQIVDPVSRGGLQGSSSSHSSAGDEERADEPGKGFFRTFPQIKKRAKVAPHSGSELPPH